MTITIPSNSNSCIQMPTKTNPKNERPEDIERLGYSAAEVADMLGIGERTIWRWVEAGTIPSVRIGGRRIISARTLRELIDGKEEPGNSVENSGEL